MKYTYSELVLNLDLREEEKRSLLLGHLSTLPEW